jgi:hypothetical protein
MLPVDDGYVALPSKAKATFQWALSGGYDYCFHCDDDTYVQPERLLSSGFEQHDYLGRLRGPSGGYPAPYCSGFAYWLSRRAMEIIVSQPLTSDTADDRWLGNVLHSAGVVGTLDERYRVTKCDERLVAGNKGNPREDCMVGNALHAGGVLGVQDNRYVIVASPNGANTPFASEGPRVGNDTIAACEFEPPAMHRIHQQWLGTPAAPVKPLPQGRLSNVCIVIKTFLRDGFLLQCIAGIQKTLPECKIIIIDDGDADSSPISRQKNLCYETLRRAGHVCHWLPKDSGFGAKSNAAIRFCDRPYVLIGSDDFDFSEASVRAGIERMVSVLQGVPDIGIASGRVNNRSYEMTLELGEDWARAKDGYHARGEVNGISYQLCDLTINYSLIRRDVFEKVRWDDDVKIGGGEHGAFFVDVKRSGWKVCVVSGVNIREMAGTIPGNHPAYAEKRMRAKDPARPCYERRGIKHFLTSAGCEMHGPQCEF